MASTILDQTVDFYYGLFDRIFSEPFRSRITDRLKRDAVIRQVEESAAAASRSLTRFFLNERLTEQQVAEVLSAFTALPNFLKLDDIANPNVTPEEVVDDLLPQLPCPRSIHDAGRAAVYRVAMHSNLQVLMLVGPVMAEWQKLSFSSTFELPRRVIDRLNQISQRLEHFGPSAHDATDEAFELTYRDYLLQRFHRVEVGTVRMTTSLGVDLRELFVMPGVRVRPSAKKATRLKKAVETTPMDLEAARMLFGAQHRPVASRIQKKDRTGTGPLIEQVKKHRANVIIGPPGSGKSTFLEWLQLRLAAVEEELVMADKQAIPLLLRVRELNPRDLPTGARLIEKATASQDRATLMPQGWIDRQLDEGRVFFMLDGLDEVEPDLRDRYLIPWLRALCLKHPKCRYLVSARPFGYAAGSLNGLGFAECELLDFGPTDIQRYTRNWCTAVRLARNEPEAEARREGAKEGKEIVAGFKDHPYILSLARNPLMLSAICLVKNFERGKLPDDRVLLYKLCVEGLLHHWDQRRGIYSEFGLDEKLRVCREVALAMQAKDRAEYEAKKVYEIFTTVLDDPTRANKLIEHVRYRTGLLLERRQGIFAFAHLTFQEYLAALAINEGNRLSLTVKTLAHDHANGRWNEVIALYCRLAPAASARELIECLIHEQDSAILSHLLGEAYLSAGTGIASDLKLREKVLRRIAIGQQFGDRVLERFPTTDVARIANRCVGRCSSTNGISASHEWLFNHPRHLKEAYLFARLRRWRQMNPFQVAELIHLLHAYGTQQTLTKMAADTSLYRAPGPKFPGMDVYGSQAVIILAGLSRRAMLRPASRIPEIAFLQLSRTISDPTVDISGINIHMLNGLHDTLPQNIANREEYALQVRQLKQRLVNTKPKLPLGPMIAKMESWAKGLSRAQASRSQRGAKPKRSTKREVRKTSKGG